MNKDYQGIADSELAPGQPVTSALMFRMRDDALAVLQNDVESLAAGIRGNFVGQRIYYTVPGSTSLVVPDGVRRLGVTLVGGGGGGQGATNNSEVNGTAGGDTTLTANGITYTAQGGQANGLGGGTSNIPFAGGLSVNGTTGLAIDLGGVGGSTMFGNGGRGSLNPVLGSGSNGTNATGYGSGGGGARNDTTAPAFHGGHGGGSGAVAMFTIAVTPGATVNITVGGPGLGGDSIYDGGLGGAGLIILEY